MRTTIVLSFSVALMACGGKGNGFGDDGGPDASTDGNGGPDACTAFCGVDSGSQDSGAMLGCSGDLRNVIDGSGNVVMTCPDSEGCAGGVCVPACQAAGASQGSIGCDYVIPTPSFYVGIAPPCWAVYIANNWPSPVTPTVTWNGTTYNISTFGRMVQAGTPTTSWPAIPTGGIPSQEVAVLFMEQDPSSTNAGPLTCAALSGDSSLMPAVSQSGGTQVAGTGKGHAWHVSTDLPVTMYDILPYGGASSYLPSAELLFPTSAWGTNYFGIVPQRGSSQPQWGQIVAYESGTTVTVFPNVALPSGGGVAAAPANTTTTYTLNANDYVQWQDTNEMSGTIISSNNPIGFFGGLGYDCYSDLTSTGGGCDSAHQQVPPVSAYGSEYAVPPYTTREMSLKPESIRYRFVGAVKGTTLTYDPPITGETCTDCTAPTTLTEGQIVDFETDLAFVVKSQDNNHPFYVGQVMTGCFVTSGSRPPGGCLGDEEYVNILAPAQFLQQYVFATDPTYPTTNLVFTRVKTASGFQDVNLDCLTGPLTGWTPVDTAGKYEVTNVDLIRGNTQNGKCNNGPHVANSTGPFGIMVWGLDDAASYAYPAGGNVAPINTVIVPPTPH